MAAELERVEQDWVGFDEASAFLVVPHVELARMLLSGTLRFRVEKRSPGADAVLRMDVRVSYEDLRDLQRRRWDSTDGLRADELVNRAAMKFGKHPTRSTPGVRGKGRPKGEMTRKVTET